MSYGSELTELKKLKSLTNKVLWELEHNESTRNSDRMLIASIYADFYGVGIYEPWIRVVGNTSLPSFESIRRTRQRIQEDRVDLRAVSEVEEQRISKQVDYIEFANNELEI